MNTSSLPDNPGRPVRRPRPWVRSMPVRTMFRLAEIADLQQVSRVWGIPTATVVWTIVVNQIARWRRRKPDLGQHGLAIAAGFAVTRYITERRCKPAG